MSLHPPSWDHCNGIVGMVGEVGRWWGSWEERGIVRLLTPPLTSPSPHLTSSWRRKSQYLAKFLLSSPPNYSREVVSHRTICLTDRGLLWSECSRGWANYGKLGVSGRHCIATIMLNSTTKWTRRVLCMLWSVVMCLLCACTVEPSLGGVLSFEVRASLLLCSCVPDILNMISKFHWLGSTKWLFLLGSPFY